MVVVTKKQFLKHEDHYLSLIAKGCVFIYPTDTIYGLGCDATQTKAVQHVYALKQRSGKPLSVIAPSKDWIIKNCVVDKKAKQWLKKLPGKYTLILQLKNKKAVAKHVHLGDYTLGVRIPKHWFAAVVQQYGKPIVTTSVNMSGMPFMTSLHDLSPAIKQKVAFIVYEGVKKAHPSTIVDLSSLERKEVRKRK